MDFFVWCPFAAVLREADVANATVFCVAISCLALPRVSFRSMRCRPAHCRLPRLVQAVWLSGTMVLVLALARRLFDGAAMMVTRRRSSRPFLGGAARLSRRRCNGCAAALPISGAVSLANAATATQQESSSPPRPPTALQR